MLKKKEAAREAGIAAFKRIAVLEDIFSNYRPSSEVNRLLSTAYNNSSQVSTELYTVLNESLLFYAETDGAFDVTVGPYTDIWREARKTGQLPPPDTLAALGKQVGAGLLCCNRKTTSCCGLRE